MPRSSPVWRLAQAARQRLEADPTLQAAAEAAKKAELLKRAPIFRGAAAEAQRIVASSWLLSGPAETGKTFGGLYRLDQLARQFPDQYILARKVRNSMDSTVLNTWRRIIELGGDVKPFGGERPVFYLYPNGAKVWIVGFDNPDKILSGEFGAAYVNQAEELEEQDFETLTTRVTGRGSVTPHPMVFGDCNPGPADHWIKRRQQAKQMTLLESVHQDNPTLYYDDGTLTPQGERTMRVLKSLTGTRRLRLYLGMWVGAEGQYFTQWDAELLHTCKPFTIPSNWRVWGGFDYGFAHNTAFYLFTEFDGIVYIVGEHVQHKWLVKQHAEAMQALCTRVLQRPIEALDIVAGHDVFAQRGDEKAKTIAQQYAMYNIRFRRAQIDRVNRAQYLSERLGNPEAHVPTTLRVFSTCERLIETIPAMVVDPHRTEDVLKTNADAEGRGGDDPYDAMTYGLMEASRMPEPPLMVSSSETTL